MNQEIINKLKELKFPAYKDDVLEGEPTLEDLILACGLGFRTLILHTQFNKKLSKPWEAVPNKKLRADCKGQKGENPKEAIAKLWIALQV